MIMTLIELHGMAVVPRRLFVMMSGGGVILVMRTGNVVISPGRGRGPVRQIELLCLQLLGLRMAGMTLGQNCLMGGMLEILAGLKMAPGLTIMPGRLMMVAGGGQMVICRRRTIRHDKIRWPRCCLRKKVKIMPTPEVGSDTT